MTAFAQETASTALSQALKLSEQDLACFPCAWNKRPTTPHGFKDASREPGVLKRLWEQYPGPFVGVPTGEVSGIDVLDIDARHGGREWLIANRPRLPATRVHRTRSGGLHLLFRHLPGLRCSAGRVAPGVDVRASGGYVIWWPAAGLPVVWSAQPALWPDWLWSSHPPNPRRDTRRTVVPDEVALGGLIRAVASGRPGERNSLTFWAACRAGEMVSSGLLHADNAVAVIAEAASRSGLPLSEARRTAWSGIRTTAGGAHA